MLGLPAGDPRVRETARAAFANYAKVLADFVLIGSLGPDEVRRRVNVARMDRLDEVLAAGRGCILAAPHMGAWDMGASYAGALGYRIAAVADPFPGSLDRAVIETRSSLGLRVIPFGRSAVRAIGQELAAGAIVCLVCDLEHGPGIEVDFFGRRAVVPNGPAAFAMRTGAPLVPACVTFGERPGTYEVVLDDPLPVDSEGGRDEQRRLMQALVHRFEEFIRPRPEQWFAFRAMFS